MKKKLVFIGVGLLVTALVLFIISGYLLSNGFSKNVNVTSLKVNPDNFTYLPISYNNSISAIAIYSISENQTNLYIFNSSLFSRWYSYMSVNHTAVSGYEYAQHIGASNSSLFRNTTIQVVPINLRGSSANSFAGKIYVVVDNTKGSKSASMHVNTSISFVPLSGSTILVSAGLGYGVLILGIAAIIIIVWGLLKKDDSPPKAVAGKGAASSDQKKYVDQLYKGVKKNK